MNLFYYYFPISVDFVINEMPLFETVLFFFKNHICVISHVTELDVKSLTTLLQNSTLSEKIAKTKQKNPCNSFVLSYEGKSVETLWLELKETLNAGIGKFIPSKFVGQKHLPWITQSIRRDIRKRDRLYKNLRDQKLPRTGKHS